MGLTVHSRNIGSQLGASFKSILGGELKGMTKALVERVNRSGELFLSHTKLRGRYVLRLAIGNARTREVDVRRAWEVLQREAKEVI